MTSSSPEYAITKPGMPPDLPRKRNKILRTYGRKCVPTAEEEPRGEPPAEKVPSEPTLGVESPSPTTPSAPAVRDAIPGPSILHYFRPLPVEPGPQKSTEKTHVACTTSPPTNTPLVRRNPRLLKIRCSPLPSDTWPEETAPSSLVEKKKDGAGEGGRSSSSSSSSSSTASVDEKSKRLLRSDRRDQVSDQTRAAGTSRQDGNKDRRRLGRRPPTVQTTLNITSQAAFAECKVCDTVWNPLYPDDVRYHEKRHRSLLRRKRKREEEEL